MNKTYTELCSEFDELDFKPVFNVDTEDFPKDWIPAGAEIVVSVDRAVGRDVTCKGYWKDGHFFVQEFVEAIHDS